ncbi:MAG: hypothetical protein GXY58_03950 [Planctomycetaceae bacterium]|nr:hypothetical protein [Planctomycetaceae bacterium]
MRFKNNAVPVLTVLAWACGLVGLLAVPAVGTEVRVAYMYSDWPDGAARFRDEFDQAFATLGWQVTKFENRQAQELTEQLATFDMVVGGGVSNYSHAQDFRPYAAQWQAFLQRGGVVIATDASYDAINGDWIGGMDPAFRTSGAACSAHTRPSPETVAVSFTAGDPLLGVSEDLQAGLSAKTNWAHLDGLGPGWSIAARCVDDKPVLAYRPVGRGLLVITNYLRFMGSGTAGTGLLHNALTMARARQQGLQLLQLTWPPTVLGRNQLSLRVGNLQDHPVRIGAVCTVSGDGAPPPARVEQTVAARAESELVVEYDMLVRGEQRGTLELMQDDRVVLTIPRQLVVPELVTVDVRSRHQYPHYGTVNARITLAPDLAPALNGLRVELQLIGQEASSAPVVVTTTELQLEQSVPLAGLPSGNYRLTATLIQDSTTLGQNDTAVCLHPEPIVKYNRQGVCYVRGAPFFPLGMYHVAWKATREQMLQCVQDLADAGFNTVHTSCSDLDVFQEVLDRAEALGIHVITEGLRADSPGLRRFMNHPAVLAWNSGDEPDITNVTPAEVGHHVDAIRDVDPRHLVYTTIASPELMHRYAPYTDVFSNDPYPLTGDKTDTLAVAQATARARAAVGPERALWMVPQCFGYTLGTWRVPTPAQERSMTYLALIEGANGLIWYTYDDVQFRVLDHPELWAMMKQLTREIRTLVPVLLEPAAGGQRFAAGPDGCLRGVAIRHGGELTVLTAHTNAQDLGPQELVIPGLPADGSAEVMFEDRRVEVADGRIHDAYAPYAVHVYRMQME